MSDPTKPDLQFKITHSEANCNEVNDKFTLCN